MNDNIDLTTDDFESTFRVLEYAREHYDDLGEDMQRALVDDAHTRVQTFEVECELADIIDERVK